MGDASSVTGVTIRHISLSFYFYHTQLAWNRPDEVVKLTDGFADSVFHIIHIVGHIIKEIHHRSAMLIAVLTDFLIRQPCINLVAVVQINQ